jgi:16S rRNA C1402 (ribose-2'-O) methylase RsmI
LKRDYNISEERKIKSRRNLSKSIERVRRNQSKKTIKKINQSRVFLVIGTKRSKEQIQKMKKKKNLHKKYLYKNVPREVNYSGVVFE